MIVLLQNGGISIHTLHQIQVRNIQFLPLFFRRLLKFNEETQKLEYAHSITWAIIDVENQKYYNNSLIDQRTPEIGLERLRKGEIVKDERIRKSAIEMLEKGNVLIRIDYLKRMCKYLEIN